MLENLHSHGVSLNVEGPQLSSVRVILALVFTELFMYHRATHAEVGVMTLPPHYLYYKQRKYQGKVQAET